MTLVLVLAGLLVGYAVLCVVLAFLRNVIVHLAARGAAWVARRRAWRRVWRGFVAEYGGEFVGPQYAWPPKAPTFGSGPIGGAQ